MFQSYKFIKYLEYKDDKYSWEYELTDSEFGTVSGVGVGVVGRGRGRGRDCSNSRI